jgi:hypothetical protein
MSINLHISININISVTVTIGINLNINSLIDGTIIISMNINIGPPTSGIAQHAMREAVPHARGVSKARQL